MASQDDVQFRCKLCHFMSPSKQHIADHFMGVHAAVEVVSGGDATPEGPTQPGNSTNDESAANDGMNMMKMELAKSMKSDQASLKGQQRYQRTPIRRKVGLRSNALRSTISHLVRTVEKVSRTPKTVVPKRRQIKIEISDFVKAGSKTLQPEGRRQRRQKMHRKYDDFVVFNDGPATKHEKLVPPQETTETKQRTTRRSKRQAGSSTNKQLKALEKSSLSPAQFKEKTNKELNEWFEKWKENHKAVMETCPDENCNLQLSSSEMELHNQCHIQNYYGFKCPHCKYMHSQWRSMKLHIRDEHTEVEKPFLNCDSPGCSVSTTVMWALKRHVMRDHIEPQILKIHTPKKEDAVTDTAEGQADEQGTTGNLAVEEHEGAVDLKPKMESEYRVIRKATKPKRKRKGIEEVFDEGIKEEEAEEKMRKKKRFHRIAWLPTCSVCEAKYISVENMDAHMAAHVVENSDSVKCSECSLVLNDKAELKAHMQEFHKRLLKVYRCDHCKYAGDRHYDFKKHLIIHEPSKPCICEMCGKMMSTRYNLKVHLLRCHATEEQKTLQCAHCTYRCADIIVLKDHMRFQHNLMWNGDLYKSNELQSYKCDLCSYVGRKASSLKYHMRVHTENRQFQCSLCPYASKTKNNLILHTRTHKGLKPVNCPHCDYTGATNKVVNEHVSSKHEGLRSFRCPCGWSTAYSGNMWKHMQVHREKEDEYKDIAETMYKEKSKKKKAPADSSSDEFSRDSEAVPVAIVHEVQVTEGEEMHVVQALPLDGTELQLNSLVQAVGIAAESTSGAMEASQEQPQEIHDQQEDNQAATFLCKLAQAVSSEQQAATKQADGTQGDIHVQCEVDVPATADSTVEQTIQELILW